MVSTTKVPLKTAREIANLHDNDGDWNLDKIEKSNLLEIYKSLEAGQEWIVLEQVIFLLHRDLDRARDEIANLTSQWKALSEKATELNAILAGADADLLSTLRQKAGELSTQIASKNMSRAARRAAQAALMVGLRYMTAATILEWPHGRGRKMNSEAWRLIAQVHTENPGLSVEQIRKEAKRRYRALKPRPKERFPTPATVKRSFRKWMSNPKFGGTWERSRKPRAKQTSINRSPKRSKTEPPAP